MSSPLPPAGCCPRPPIAFLSACVLLTAALAWTVRMGNTPETGRAPFVLAATTEAAGSQDITIHIGIPSNQEGGLLSLIVMAVNRSPAQAENVVVVHRMPAGLRFLAEESDKRCSLQGDEILCSLMGNGRGFVLRSGQSVSFTLAFQVEECTTPSQHQSLVRRSGGGDLARRTTNIAFSCEEMMKLRSVSSRSSSPPLSPVAPSGSKESLPSLPPAPPPLPSSPGPSPWQTLEPCLPFCTSTSGTPACKLLCTSISTAPLKSYLCDGKRVASFRCEVFPRTSRDGAYPRSSCEYECE